MKERKDGFKGQIRQGDVLVMRAGKSFTLDTSKGPAKRDARGRVVLAEGEVTGHAHAICEPNVALYPMDAMLAGLKVDKLSTLVHDEHGTLTIEPGTYVVKRQREFMGDEARRVED